MEEIPEFAEKALNSPTAAEGSLGLVGPDVAKSRTRAPQLTNAESSKPKQITSDRRHQYDPGRRRATFVVPYPTIEVELARSSDQHTKLPPRFESGRRTVKNTRFLFSVPNILIMNSDFIECKFHRLTQSGESRILCATFISCNFERSIFGGTAYKHVRFELCHFRRCDFGLAQFFDCQFHLCTFTECTSEHVSFTATEISPTALLAGTIAPHYNYDSSYDGELSPEALDREWLEVRRALAAQMLKSNTEIHHSDNSDAALVELKTAELKVRFDQLKSRSLRSGVRSLVSESVRYVISRAVLTGTNGGTSVARLIFISTCAIPLYAFLLSLSTVTFQGRPCLIKTISTPAIVEQLTRATALFLAIGYSEFYSNNTTELALLTLGAALGLIWYALLAAVVIRRVYR